VGTLKIRRQEQGQEQDWEAIADQLNADHFNNK
jgi:hypothetical protein